MKYRNFALTHFKMKKNTRVHNNINNLIKQKKLKINDVVKKSGYTRDNLARIRRGENGLNQENMPRIATGLGCYPSELLPIEWQKPAELDEKLLEEALSHLDLILEDVSPELRKEFTYKERAHLIKTYIIKRQKIIEKYSTNNA